MAETRLLAVAVLLAAVAAASCYPQAGNVPQPRLQMSQANINEYFDEVTPQIRDFFLAAGMDPLELEDHIQTFNVTDLLGIVWHGELGLQKGWLTDLSLFERSGDAYVTYDDLDLNISISLTFPDVALSYDFVAQIMDIGPDGAIHGKVEDLQVHLEVGGKLADQKLQLYDFQYLDYGKVTFHLEGTMLDLVENAILDVVTALFRGPVMDYVEVRMRGVIGDLLENVDLGDIANGVIAPFCGH